MKKFSLIAFAAIFALAAAALAEEKITEPAKPQTILEIDKYFIDGNKYISKTDAISAFLNIAINRTYKAGIAEEGILPVEDRGSSTFFKKEKIKQHYPWLYPLIYSPYSSENSLKLSKWTQPIRVAVGYPPDFYKPNPDLSVDTLSSPYEKLNPKTVQILTEKITQTIPELEALTHLPIKYILPYQDEGDQRGNLRIVLVSYADYWETKFKRGLGGVSRGGVLSVDGVETGFPSYTAFTPQELHQVEGYYLPNNKNEIQFAVCKIWDGQPPEIIKQLSLECLVRALGFTGTQGNYKNSVFYPANRPVPNNKPTAAVTELSPYDKLMISTLYAAELTEGQTLEAALKTLINDGEKNDDGNIHGSGQRLRN